MQIEGLDHLVLTVADVGRTRDFYERVLGMEPVVFGEGRHACYKSRRMGRGRRYNPLMSGPLLLGGTCPERTAEPIITEGGQRCCWCETGFTPPFQITSRHPYCFTATIVRVSAFVNGVPNSGTYFRYD